MEMVLWMVWVVVWGLILRGVPTSWAQDSCEQCDCKFSSNEEDRAIFNLKNSLCRSGSLQWTSAYGAIRFEIQPFQHQAYRLCFVLHSHHTLTQVSREVPGIQLKNYRLQSFEKKELSSPSSSSSSLSSSSSGSMLPLVVSAGEKSPEVCVMGGARRAVMLYLEVERSHQFTGIPSVTLQYDVEPLAGVDALLADPMEECRPCTQEELLDAYCTSDFVAVGRIQEATPAGHQEDLTELNLAVEQLIHQTTPIFSRQKREDRHLRGVIHAPAKCQIRPGKETGHFLFTGRMRLGKAKLRCAPYFEDWLQISRLAECVYD